MRKVVVKDSLASIQAPSPLGFISGLLNYLQAQDVPSMCLKQRCYFGHCFLSASFQSSILTPKGRTWTQTTGVWQGLYWLFLSVYLIHSAAIYSLLAPATWLAFMPHHHPELTATWTTVKLTIPLGKSSYPPRLCLILMNRTCACSSLFPIPTFPWKNGILILK